MRLNWTFPLSLSPAGVRALANVGWLTFNHVVLMAVSAVVGFWMARHLGRDQFGQLQLAISLVVLVSPVVLLGLSDIVSRELVRRPEQANQILGSALRVRLLAAVVGIGLVWLLAWFWRPDGSLLGLALAASFWLLPQAVQVMELWFHARVESRFVVIARVAALAAGSVARVAAILLDAPPLAFAWIFSIAAAVETLVLWVLYRARGPRDGRWLVRGDEVRRLLTDAWPLALAGVAGIVYLRIDQVMIGSMIDDEAVGLYAAAVLLAEMMNFLPMAVFTSVLPGIVELRQINPTLYRRRLRQVMSGVTWIGVALAVVISLLAPLIIRLAYGREFAEAARPLVYLIWASLFAFQGVIQSVWVLAENHQHKRLVGLVAGALVNVGLNAWWIPRWGLSGAAGASIVAYAVAAYLPVIVFPSMRSGLADLVAAFLWPLVWVGRRLLGREVRT